MDEQPELGTVAATDCLPHRSGGFRWKLLMLVFVCMSTHSSWAQAGGLADLLLLNGHIYTSNPNQPWAQAIAIGGGKIIAVGTNDAVSKYKGSVTKIIDLGGRMAMPGIIDDHTHFLWGSYGLAGLQLRGARNVDAMRTLMRAYAQAHPEEKWVWGSYGYIGQLSQSPRALLDEVFPDRPVSLLSGDGHNLWVNSRALAIAGITKQTPNPTATVSGIILHDEKTGEPNGILEEGAKQLVLEHMPLTHDEELHRLHLGLSFANEHGITAVINATGDLPEMELYDELYKRGELTVRMTTAFARDVGVRHTMSTEEVATFEDARRRFPRSNDWVRAGVIKFFADGVIETHTAGMLEPYTDTPGQKGGTLYTAEEFKKDFLELDRRHFQVMTHAIGDGAVRTVLDAYQYVEQKDGPRDRRWRIEHMEAVQPDDWPRFGKLGVIAAFQPWCCPRPDGGQGVFLGPARLKESMPWQSIVSDGATLSLGSDWPVESLNPFPIMQTAVTRQTPNGKPEGGFFPEQALTLDQVLAGYTRNNAYTDFMEDRIGSLEPGKLADVIVLSQDLYAIPKNQIGKTEVLLTIVGGKVVLRKGL
jgi:predicted amidohydrolase YtcJ